MMTAKEFYEKEKPYLWNSDDPQKDEGFYGKEDMIKFANNYTLSIVEKVVGDVEDQIKHDASEPDAFMALHFFLTRIKNEIGE